jgi:hypothetical protein
MKEEDEGFRRDLSMSEKLISYESSDIWDIEIDSKERLWLSIREWPPKVRLLNKSLELIGEFPFDPQGDKRWAPLVKESPLGRHPHHRD